MATRKPAVHEKDSVVKTPAFIGDEYEAFAEELLAIPGVRKGYEEANVAFRVARIIKDMRLAAGLTQISLATRVGVTQTSIARLERGQGKHGLRFATVKQIADACGVEFVMGYKVPDAPSESLPAPKPEMDTHAATHEDLAGSEAAQTRVLVEVISRTTGSGRVGNDPDVGTVRLENPRGTKGQLQHGKSETWRVVEF